MGKVVWREWFNESAVKQLTEMGTLPRNEVEINGLDILDGEEVARAIAENTYNQDPEWFREGGEIVIMEPNHLAGTYDITTEYEPCFYASKRSADEEQ